MKILAISKEIPPVDWEAQTDILKEESEMLHQLYLGGHVREFYFTEEGDAVLILESSSLAEARGILAQLPLVSKGLIIFDLMELKPYSGFARIINT